jgi:hypothetical protein
MPYAYGEGGSNSAAPADIEEAVMAEEKIGVGSYLYAPKGSWGRAHDGRGKYTLDKFMILDETTQSWLVSSVPGRSPPLGVRKCRVNKHTMLEADGIQKGMALRWFTKDGAADHLYREANRWKIAKMVEHADAGQLRQIAEIVGYVEHKK